MYILEGKIELFQNSIPNKHIDLDFIMNFVNKLYDTRRVERRFDIDKSVFISHKFLKYPIDAYGRHGEYFLEDSDVFPESILDINDYGPNPSLWCPFYIEKNKNRYFLNFDEFPKGNNLLSISNWLINIHRKFFFLNNIYSKGEITITNNEEKINKTYYFDEDGVKTINRKNEMISTTSKNIINEMVDNGKWSKYRYYPKIFDYMAEEIEQNLQNDKKKVNKLDNDIKKIDKDNLPEMN